jgi:hypothetical protein
MAWGPSQSGPVANFSESAACLRSMSRKHAFADIADIAVGVDEL